MNGHDYEELKRFYFSYIGFLPYFGSKEREIDVSRRHLKNHFVTMLIMGIALIIAGVFTALYGFHNGIEGAFNSDKRNAPLVILIGMIVIGVVAVIVGLRKISKVEEYLVCKQLYNKVSAEETLSILGDWIKEDRISNLLLCLPAAGRTLLTVAEMVTLIETIKEEADNAAKQKLHKLITG